LTAIVTVLKNILKKKFIRKSEINQGCVFKTSGVTMSKRVAKDA